MCVVEPTIWTRREATSITSDHAGHILTAEEIGRAMITVAEHGASKQILESQDIRAIVHS